jgi:hypothetical protein
MKKSAIFLICFCLLDQSASSQGCVIVRNISGFGQYNLTDNAFTTSEWQLNINNRYFKAYKDYKGTINQKVPQRNESVVKSFSTDISIGRLLRNGWSLDLSIPVAANSRETSVEHGGANTTRHTTHSFGIGDIRFIAYKWILRPTVRQRANIQLGLGIKFPTGAYNYQDFFYRNDSTRVLSAVNPSIQLGDGGTGIITELNTFFVLNAKRTLSLYGNFYYMANPREQNATAITFGRTPARIDSLANNIFLSVNDQYSIRAGINYSLKNWAFSLGIRDEGIPVEDIVGGSEGVRRAGHNLSVEPGIIYKFRNVSLYAYVPVIVQRETKQTLADQFKTKYTGTYVLTPGGFGDYLVFAGVLFKL